MAVENISISRCMMRKGKALLVVLLVAVSLLAYYYYSRPSFHSKNDIHSRSATRFESRFPERSHISSRARNTTRPKQFTIKAPFFMPQPAFSRPVKVLLRSKWHQDLKDYLRTVDGNELSMVTSSVEHTDVLLNWLIAAYVKIKDPIKNVMVLSMDDKLHSILVNRGLPSVYVHKDMVINPRVSVPRVFNQVHVTRMAVWRLMNHYGFDVINYDCDAIPLRNPQPVFDKYKTTDLIGTFGKGPNILYEKWGVALNTGLMVLRATPAMEYFWNQVQYGKNPPIPDDQNSLNFCLEHLGMEWLNYDKSERIEDRPTEILGRAAVITGSLSQKVYVEVMLMPYTVVCRHVCEVEDKDKYYVWHALAIRSERTVANKKSQASVGGAWYLNDNWRVLSDERPDLKGADWLRHISN